MSQSLAALSRGDSLVPAFERARPTWHADTDEWTYQHRVVRKRPTPKQSEQLAKMFDQAGSATRRREET
jgi:hypothetical protein